MNLILLSAGWSSPVLVHPLMGIFQSKSVWLVRNLPAT